MESALSTLAQETLPVRGGCVAPDAPELVYMAVINRHAGPDAIAVGLVRGAGLRGGALASTVAHDCHNLIVVYDTPENALLAANELIACGGGTVTRSENMRRLCRNGTVICLTRPLDALATADRPLSADGVAHLYKARRPLYEAYADLTVDCDGLTLEQTVQSIVSALQIQA
mgnify:CR=1 FL=1